MNRLLYKSSYNINGKYICNVFTCVYTCTSRTSVHVFIQQTLTDFRVPSAVLQAQRTEGDKTLSLNELWLGHEGWGYFLREGGGCSQQGWEEESLYSLKDVLWGLKVERKAWSWPHSFCSFRAFASLDSISSVQCG